MSEITTLLARARDGDRQAFDMLFERLYPELRRLAHAESWPANHPAHSKLI
jgi:thiamine phosphate synthase YjbQ (UPF0047 family)